MCHRHLRHQVELIISEHATRLGPFKVFPLSQPKEEVGSGIIGDLGPAIPGSSFIHFLKERMELKVVRHTPILHKEIKKVAVLGGSGSFAIDKAINAGDDVYVTADLKYHDFFRAEKKIILADIGHYESEQFTKNLLVDYLTKKISNFAPALPTGRIILSKINTNPINYF